MDRLKEIARRIEFDKPHIFYNHQQQEWCAVDGQTWRKRYGWGATPGQACANCMLVSPRK